MNRPFSLRDLAPPGPPSWHERRLDKRHRIRVTGGIRPVRGRMIPVEVTDLSATGCRIDTDLFRPGEMVWIAVPPLAPMMAWIQWRRGGQAGLRFERALHRSVLAHLVQRHRPPGGSRDDRLRPVPAPVAAGQR